MGACFRPTRRKGESVLRLVALPFCRVAMVAPWNEPAARRFVAYRCRDGFPCLLGHPVIDEFATISSPIFFGPRALAGKLYNAGLSLGHRRDPEMGIDLGWPPLVVGLGSGPAPDLTADWEEQLLDALMAVPAGGESLAAADAFSRRQVGGASLERAVCGEAVLWATDAPLLPKQLGRLCEVSRRPLALALNTRPLIGAPGRLAHEAAVVSERRLVALLAAARELEE
jgi:hypothetical protein